MARLTFLIGSVSLLLLLTACGGGTSIIPTGPTSTPDPVAFYAPTPISPGNPANPLPIVYVPPIPNAEALETSRQAIETALEAASSLTLDVLTVETQAEALDVLCDSSDGDRFVAAWLNGPTAVLAEAAGCGQAVLEVTMEGQDGLAGEIVAASAGSINSLSGRTFCRLENSGLMNFYTWTLPTLAMQSASLDITRLEGVLELTSESLVIPTVEDGSSCFAVGVPMGWLETEASDTNLRSIYTSPVIPLGVLFIPDEMMLVDRERLIQAYLDVAEYVDPESDDAVEQPEEPRSFFQVNVASLTISDERKALLWLSGGDSVAPATSEDLDEMRDFMEDAGFDVEQYVVP
jgi:hypothetical protein